MAPLETDVNIVKHGDKTFFEKKAYLVDSTFLKVFPYDLTEGNKATALDAPATVLISQDLAKRIFGDGSALDESLIINSGTTADTFRIAGVVAKPEFRHISMQTFYEYE